MSLKFNNNGLNIFLTMGTWILTVLLICILISTISCDSNLTEYNLYPACPVAFKRIKRAPIEYTRWRVNSETSSEFIVKIFDDDISTSKAKEVIAVNIEPITKGKEKIIIGGAMVSQKTSSNPFMMSSKDYTRFVLPTTIPIEHINDDLYLAPVRPKQLTEKNFPPKQLQANYGQRKNLNRDDSPPAGPQFLSRTPGVLSQQYAAVTSVAFATRSTISPVLPPSMDFHDIHRTTRGPTRTIPLPKIIVPTRTTTGNENDLFADDQTTETGRRYEEQNIPQRSTSNQYEFIDAEESIFHATKNTPESIKDEEENKNSGANAEHDSNYVTKLRDPDYDDKPTRTRKYDDIMYNYDDIQNSISPIDKEYQTKPDIYMNSDSDLSINKNDNLLENSLSARKYSDREHNKVCNLIKLRNQSFDSPRTLPEIVSQLKTWAETSPLVKLIDITSGNLTAMENKIFLVMVDDPSSGQIVSAKKIVLIIAGIQGRDHHAVSTALYVLYQLIERTEAHSDLLSRFRFWIIPVFNPDGYDYSMTFPHRREWTKNLKQTWNTCIGRESCYACESYGLRCTVQSCYGVNLDRNFEYQWIPAEELRSEHPCGKLYAGFRQLSEAETRALTHYLHQQTTQLFTFIAFKEGEVLGVMYPYSHTRKKRTFDHIYRQRASRAAAAASSISGRPYLAGQTSEFLPLYAGGIEDWVDGHLGIDNTYTIMMFRPNDAYNSKLATERVVHEAYAAMDTLLLESVEPLGLRVATVMEENSKKTEHLSYVLFCISLFSSFFYLLI
ncbi:uncharacterized protein LOC101746291 isoform X2 [Bombyx mori]|uniref:Peptidase M14 domain-containing protein n=1 Tax=Bombyx mori TaxID=7091 RepID=A0A8R2DKK0_BOMMO|nr:uncharacterized protein LOC101746291 isoform X1 [Bombyx mori]